MCGIAGIFNINGKPINTALLRHMASVIRHRGPDDEGFLLVNTPTGEINHCSGYDTIPALKKTLPVLPETTTANLGLAFRRLSILDLSSAGHQPMASADGKLWITFNGEIYNYIELREELKQHGHQFRTRSDTEVILAAYRQWGINCLHRFNGMWAFALWDQENQRLFCARDRFGIKPFNYYFNGQSFVWGSEIKQMLLHDITRKLNTKMIYRSLKLPSFLIYGDETYFEEISLLPHGHYLLVETGHLSICRYYDLDPEGFETFKGSFQEACEGYRRLFLDAVKLRMRADVEVGSCLSGGLDSSGIVCAAVKHTDKSFSTFSSYYTEIPRYDERKWIELVARNAGATTHYVSPDANDVAHRFHNMTHISDYPLSGSSFITQNYVMKLARSNNVIVLLDGQGSDEITAGYNHAFFRYYADLLRKGKLGRLAKEFPAYLRYNQKGSPLSRIIKTFLVFAFSESRLYREETKRLFDNPLSYKVEETGLFDNIIDLPTGKLSNFLYNLMMSTSIQTLLHYEDRNSMNYSIESRVPFLDYRLVEYAFTLPSHYKVCGNLGKYVHREALRQIVPAEIINRTDKVNFASPGEVFWLKRELKPLVDRMLNEPSAGAAEHFNLKKIEARYKEYLAGNDRLGDWLWKLMATDVWFREFTN